MISHATFGTDNWHPKRWTIVFGFRVLKEYRRPQRSMPFTFPHNIWYLQTLISKISLLNLLLIIALSQFKSVKYAAVGVHVHINEYMMWICIGSHFTDLMINVVIFTLDSPVEFPSLTPLDSTLTLKNYNVTEHSRLKLSFSENTQTIIILYSTGRS